MEQLSAEKNTEAQDKIKVLLVDDHQVVRDGLRHMLGLESDIKVVAEAATGDEALTQAELCTPDIVLLDIKMPGASGIETIRRLKEMQPDCNIIMLTLYEEYVAEAIEAGASGYLLKDVKREELAQAIRLVKHGKAPLSPLSRDLLTEFSTLIRGAKRSNLSDRESEILRLIAGGSTTKEISSQLFLSEATVKRDVQRIFEKLNVRNRSEAIAEAYKKKLI